MRSSAVALFAFALLLAPATSAVPTAFAAEATATAGAEAAAAKWLALVDSGRYAESWDEAAAYFRGAIGKAGWESSLKGVRAPLGAKQARTLKSAVAHTSLPGAPDGHYVVIQYDTRFEHKAGAVETVTPMQEADGSWKVSGYQIR